ncbi:DAK2 domain-containing protein [Fictibacillus sp. Mic-4]|uniref:DAK2 domain-containing protein n=1 Tax=Fictibacillus sp. Mic-4 TaxID=3132826 RepID=UPI003CE6AC41
MSLKVLDGKKFSAMVQQGAANLAKNRAMIDALNVFPVPDGDTGTNMSLTIVAGSKEVENNPSSEIGIIANAFSRGLLMGARGNSGVILSQLFRGFAKAVEGKKTLLSVEFARAFENGVETAYKAVMKPIEGTILTVAKDAARHAVKMAKKTDDIHLVMSEIVQEAKRSLNRTPDLLPVLKEVGVVDSGGQGLVAVYEGFLNALEGKEPAVSDSAPSMQEMVNSMHHKAQLHMKTEDIQYGYCTEFMVKLDKNKANKLSFSEERFRNELSRHGDSLLVVSDDELVKVHIHTEKPGDMLNIGQRYGSLINLKIENMREQHSAIVGQESAERSNDPTFKQEKKAYGIVTVAMGSGIRDLFQSLGASSVLEGGQTMNPSTEDIARAISGTHAKTVFVLPNNSNIIMAAEQAASVVDEEVVIIPTKTIPQGIAALLAFNPSDNTAANQSKMANAIHEVKTGQVTVAVRNTSIEGVEIKKGDYMGIQDGKIIASKEEKHEAAIELVKQMIDDDSEIVSIFAGEDATEEQTDQLVSFIEEQFPDLEVEVHSGKQPIYDYIISVE